MPVGIRHPDLFTPEINSDAPTPARQRLDDDNALTMRTQLQVHAILERDRRLTTAPTKVGTPAIFGMNSSPSRPQRSSPPRMARGGYLADDVTPGPCSRGHSTT